MTRVLVASSDARLRDHLVSMVEGSGLEAIVASEGLAAFRAVYVEQLDAVLIDLAIAEVDGAEWVRMVRAASPIAIVAILGPGEQHRGVMVLDYGADDVVQPSTAPNELIARLNASIRRSQRAPADRPQQPTVIRTGDLTIDLEARLVTKDGRRISLSRTEYRLLEALASRAGQVAPHKFLLSTVWGTEYVEDVHYLRVYVGYLRGKIEDDPSSPRYIRSEWGVGYRLVVIDPWRGEPRERRLRSVDTESPLNEAGRDSMRDVPSD